MSADPGLDAEDVVVDVDAVRHGLLVGVSAGRAQQPINGLAGVFLRL
jgi:hypothetical protein